MIKQKMNFISFLFIFAVIVFSGCVSDPGGNLPDASAQQVQDEVSIPLSGISENAKWFEYSSPSSNGTTIRFFAVKANDGSIKTAFDACDVCFASKKGYRQEGNQMVCNNCGNKYPIDGLGTENKTGGGCWPGFLPNKIAGDNIVIKKSDLEKGRYRFE